MIRVLFLTLIFLLTTNVQARTNPLDHYFSKLEGQWNFITASDHGYDEDGTMWRHWKMNKHQTFVRRVDGYWDVMSFFCTLANDQEMCGDSRLKFKVSGEKLFVVYPDESEKEKPVEILSSTESSLVMKYKLGINSILQSENISPAGIWSQTIQVNQGDRLMAVQIITSKKVTQ